MIEKESNVDQDERLLRIGDCPRLVELRERLYPAAETMV